jgi:uncharacterized membrane protein
MGYREFRRRALVFARKGAGASKLMHRMFDVVVVLKGLDGVLEIIGGITQLSRMASTADFREDT